MQFRLRLLTVYDRRYLAAVGACLAALVAAHVLTVYEAVLPAGDFLILHLVLEFASIVVSFAVFLTGWFGYKQTNRPQDLAVGLTFAFAGAIEFVHVFSYKGMPDFLGANAPGANPVGVAAAYWLVARFAVGIGLLWAAFVGPDSRIRLAPSIAAAALVAAIVGAVTAITLNSNVVARAIYNPSLPGLTPVKVYLEYLVCALYLATFLSLSETRGWRPQAIAGLRIALVVAIFSELSFTLYVGPYDWFNVLGHVLKIAAYYLILHALFASAFRRPYEELFEARDELAVLYDGARKHADEMQRSFALIGRALSSSLRVDEALDRIAEIAAHMLNGNCAVVASMTGEPATHRVTTQKGACDAAHRPVELAVEVGRRSLRDRTSLIVDDIPSTGWIDCDFDAPDCLRSMVCSAMLHEGNMVGVIAVYSHSTFAFEDKHAELLETFAGHAAVALRNAITYQHESRIATALQRSILTSPRTSTNRFEFAQIYEPAMDEALLGGDFYDIIELPDDRIALAVGDVSGKGLSAAVHTALAKYTLRAYIDEGHGPAAALRLLDKMVAEYTDTETFVTLFLGILDVRTKELVYSSAGHEPAIYAHGGQSQQMSVVGPALGLGIQDDYPERRLTLEKDSLLLVYTDGISEARTGSELFGSDRLAQELVACDGLSSQDVARRIHRAAVDFGGGRLKDDTVVLVVRTLE